jgi:23S rRNA pseudouridine2605 synthase
VRILGELDAPELHRLREGVDLDDGPARFERIEAAPSRERSANRWYRVELAEGRNREVRRIFEVLGRKVSRLVRVRYGPVALPRDLRPGEWRELEPALVARLNAAPLPPG